MGFRFRKSKSFLNGAFHINFSKSGIGYSFGGKGARITKTANGKTRTTLSLPGTGISYITETSEKRRAKSVGRNVVVRETSKKEKKLTLIISVIIVMYVILCFYLGFLEATICLVSFGFVMAIVNIVKIASNAKKEETEGK